MVYSLTMIDYRDTLMDFRTEAKNSIFLLLKDHNIISFIEKNGPNLTRTY